MILVSLIAINFRLRKAVLTKKEILFVRTPFAVYFGWITVATIANFTTFFVSTNWNQFGLTEVFWTVMMIIIGALVGFVSMLFYRSFSYGFVIIWAYLGIAIKHLSVDFFDGNYPQVLIAVAVSITLIGLGEVILLKRLKSEAKNYV
jgi:hypothetical protein